mmetsp:Transcript_18359/g.26678  ORF Transcript_18359/g.26678 Transcript_18359/m.26678 type:complete len:111 (+) Transcript_18359:490-822(+)
MKNLNRILSCTWTASSINFTPESLQLVQEYIDRGQQPLILFPGPNAINLDEKVGNGNEGRDGHAQNLLKHKQLLILIDGTWAEAKQIVMQSIDGKYSTIDGAKIMVRAWC